jgi:bifunctional UDP-N-acetylglucosamine pyrophosphorylase/glucosamine-1-phosphate N-acetyltransferase
MTITTDTTFPFSIAIMAGGKGKRMRSTLPKFLHKIHGKEMLVHILNAIAPLGASKIYIIVNPEVEFLCRYLQTDLFSTLPIEFIHQSSPLGTGHALQCLVESKKSFFEKKERLVVLNADMPYLQTFLLQKMIDSWDENNDAMLLAARLSPSNSKGYGRILLRQDHLLDHIEEDKDCKDPTNSLCNMGLYSFSVENLVKAVSQLTNNNAAGEYYLTQVFDFLDRTYVIILDEKEAVYLRGVNSPEELATLESEMNL